MVDKLVLKTFKTDRLVRDASGRPLGRAVLADEYREGVNLKIAVLDIPRVSEELARAQHYYIDGNAYCIDSHTMPIRFTPVDTRLKINNFFLIRTSACGKGRAKNE